MRIRVKLTLLLLLFALVPMVTVEIVEAVSFARLRQRVDQQVSENIARRVEQELAVHVQRTAEQMGSTRARVVLMTRTQAVLFADALEGPEPTETPRVYFPEAFDGIQPGEIPPGFHEQPGWPIGTLPPPVVSYDRPVAVPPPGGAADPALIARLATVTDSLDSLSGDFRDGIRSQFFALTNGTHLAFPAKGGYDGYDPRERPWFTAAVTGDHTATRGVIWTGPYLNAITGEPGLTCSAPVRSAGGDLVGVTGVDLALSGAIDMLELPQELALGSSAWVVALEELPTGESRILMSTQSGKAEPRAQEPNDERFDGIVVQLQEGRTGSQRIAIDEQPGIAAYGPIGPSAGLVMFVPDHRIDSLISGVRQDLRSIASESARSLIAASVLVIGLCLLGAYLMGRTVSRPVRRLADAAQQISEGDLSARVEARPRGDEIGKLNRAFNEMVPALADRLRLRDSMALANELQQGLLPTKSPEIPGFDVFGIAVYCDETGGDYFDYLQPIDLGQDRYGLALGDVTGHGIPAALIMTSAKALLQSHARHVDKPHEILERMNETIARESTHGKFMTFVLLVLDPVHRTLEVANAGHDPALVLRSKTGTFEELPMGGLPLGVMPDERYETVRADIPEPGDILLVGTDGIWECRNPQGELYGKQRMREIVRTHADGSVEQIGAAILEDLKTFRGASPVLDDITFIIAKAHGNEDPSA